MDNQLKTTHYQYRKMSLVRKKVHVDPLYLTDLVYAFYSPLDSVIIVEGEFIELTYYMPSKLFKFDGLDNPQEESTQEIYPPHPR
jgi:hypothetical protein